MPEQLARLMARCDDPRLVMDGLAQLGQALERAFVARVAEGGR